MATGNERSRVLEAFRAVGVVALPLKCPVLRRGADNFVTTSVKNGFQVFDCKSLRLLFVSSPATQRGIKALEVHGDFTFAASGAVVHKFKRGKEVGQLGPLGGNVTRLLVVGDNLFVHSSDGELVGYDAKTSDEIMRMDLVTCGVTAKASRAAAKITAWVHPLSYLNKLLLGDEEGSLFVVNVRSCKCVHRFAPLGSGVTAIAQSPAIDVVAVGLADGRIVVRNIKFDETLFEFTQTDGAVTDLSFRTDNTSFLASSSSNGGVYIWDLEEQRLISSMPRAHDSQVCTCTFLQGEPILLTSGGDNALKMWIFDQDDGSARLLRSRNGHSAPPTRVRYYSQHTLLSAGQDRSFRIFSTIQDQQSREMSQGHVEKRAKSLNAKSEELKLTPVIDFDAAPLREKDWCNVLTCHQDDNRAYTWRYKNAVLGKHVLRPPALDYPAAHMAAMGEDGPKIDPFKKVPGRLPGQVVDPVVKVRNKGAPQPHQQTMAKAVCVSACGNYGVVGYGCGRIDKYNMQSGAHRGTFWAEAPAGHAAPIHGLAMTALNDELVSASFDGTVKVWSFEERRLLHSFDVGAPVNQIVLNRDNNLLAATADDLKLRLFDLSSRRLVREFDGHSNRITDVSLSPDGRWAITASADRSIRIYDIPTARLLDWVRFDRAVTGVAMSPSGDFIATSHAASVGIYLWANRTHFANVFLGYSAPTEATDLRLPTSSGPQEGERPGDAPDAPGIESYPPLLEQLTPELVTFSTVPRPRWQTLANLDTIKRRNRPTEAPKAAPDAPFFLPTLPGLEPVFTAESSKKRPGLGEESSAESARKKKKPGQGGEGAGKLPGWGDEGGEGEDGEVDWAEEEAGAAGTRENESRLISLSELRPATKFVKSLRRAGVAGTGNFALCIAALADMAPSAIDLEIRSLSVDNEGEELGLFLDMIADQLATGRNFELLQAYLSAFLNIHEEALMGIESLAAKVERAAWLHFKGRFQKVLCLIGAFGNMQ